MARFLSSEWFAELQVAELQVAGLEVAGLEVAGRSEGPAGEAGADGAGGGQGGVVVEISVTGTPEGEVRYQVVVQGASARVLPPSAPFEPPRVSLSSDYETIAGIASGRLSAVDALSQGRARFSGDMAALSTQSPGLAALDLLPPALRSRTTF
ncbi:MAG: SCP2 sterol-binding domain-containing protein [Acidimicrobiales bacterium]